jgi:hypothetical protein
VEAAQKANSPSQQATEAEGTTISSGAAARSSCTREAAKATAVAALPMPAASASTQERPAAACRRSQLRPASWCGASGGAPAAM